jgi:hypothetical protein
MSPALSLINPHLPPPFPLQGAEGRQEAALAALKAGWAAELKAQREAWGAAERAKRGAWEAAKTAEIKELTVKVRRCCAVWCTGVHQLAPAPILF